MEDEREIDLLDLIWYVCAKWRVLILAGIAGLLLVGGYKFITCEKERKAIVTDPAVIEASDDYRTKQTAVVDLENKILEQENAITKAENKKKNAEASIEIQKERAGANEESRSLVTAKIKAAESYISDSVLMNLDAYKKPTAGAIYQITMADEEATALYRDSADEIVSLYSLGDDLEDGKALSEKYGVPERYLGELFTVKAYSEANVVWVITAGTDETMAKELLASGCAFLEAKHEEITGSVPEHSFTKISEYYEEMVDTSLASSQSSCYSNLNQLNSQLVSLDSELVSINQAITDNESVIADNNLAISKAENEIAKLEPQLKAAEDALDALYVSESSRSGSIKAAVKYGLIAGVVLAILAAGIYFLIYVFDGKVHVAEDLYKYNRLELLAVLSRPAPEKGCFLDKWFYQLRNKGYGTSNEVVLKTASVTIEKLLTGEKKVAVLSSLDEKALEKVTSALSSYIPSVEFVPVADSNLSVEAAEALKDVDAVIVYEVRESSRNLEIEAELHQARLLEKKLTGCIVA